MAVAIAFTQFKPFKEAIFVFTDRIKIFYHNFSDSISMRYNQFFDQARNIANYQKELQDYNSLKLQLLETQENLQKVLSFYPQIDLFKNTAFEPALVISYTEMAEYNRVWLHSKAKLSPDHLYGIVRDGYALGIAKIKDGRLLGMFNGDENCSYSVFIGKNKVSAFIHYDPNNDKYILADFIPQYLEISVGDEVYTSGLDYIFSSNIPVGRVEEIYDKNGYVTARVKPYADRKSPEYLWIVNRNADE